MNKQEKEQSTSISQDCEICGGLQSELINVGIDIGFHIGDWGKGEYEEYKIKPQCARVFSIYLCFNCKEKLKKKGYFHINVISELKDLIKGALVKNMIIEGLK